MTAGKVLRFDAERTAEQTADDLAPVLSEDAIAREFVDRHLHAVRYDDAVGKWFVWNGARWQRDMSDIAFSWARTVIHGIAANQKSADRRRLGAFRFAHGVEGFARTDQRIKRIEWDHNIEALGTPTGIVDLRTGDFCDPDSEQYITRATAIDPSDVVDCRRWHQFLNQVTGGDTQLKTFLQQWAGYSLTAETVEQKLVFIHGPGGTGKGVFANTLMKVMSEYATSAAMETFADTKFDQHPEQLARLQGVRMVVASETEAGHKWRENRVKLLTGGDPITARFMRQDSFVFKPAFKLTFLGNHAPAITNLDSAIKRRFIVVPFVNKPAEPDIHLEEALQDEWPAILRWMIQGAVDWYSRGQLVIPASVDKATSQYFADQDVFGQWMEESCRVEPDNQALVERSIDLFSSWKTFAQSRGEEYGKQKDFNERLRHQGFEPKQIKALGTTGCRGIALKVST